MYIRLIYISEELEMSKKKTDSKKKSKGAQLIIRIDREERDSFVELCERLDTSAAREIRRFMREWVAKNQPTLIPEPVSELSEDARPASDVTTAEPAAPELTTERVKKSRKRAVASA